MAQMSVDCL